MRQNWKETFIFALGNKFNMLQCAVCIITIFRVLFMYSNKTLSMHNIVGALINQFCKCIMQISGKC